MRNEDGRGVMAQSTSTERKRTNVFGGIRGLAIKEAFMSVFELGVLFLLLLVCLLWLALLGKGLEVLLGRLA